MIQQRDINGRVVQPDFQQRLSAALSAAVRTDTGCLEWSGAVAGSGGYPVIRGADGKPTRVSHVMLSRKGAVRPSDRHLACHVCDNPRCVEPSHLFWGTASDNAKDSYNKGRGYWGTPAHRANVSAAASDLMRSDPVYKEAVLMRLKHHAEKRHG